MNVLISEEEKKQIFDRLSELERKQEDFIGEAQDQINKSTEKLNEFNGRLLKIEQEVFPDGKK